MNQTDTTKADPIAMDVILPMYREADMADQIVDTVIAYAVDQPHLHFVLVDDGSPDNTADRIQAKLDQTHTDRVSLLVYRPNRGKGYAIQKAVQQTQSPLVMFMDGDLAYSLDHIELIHEALQQADVVIGSRWLADNREANKRGTVRRMMGESFNFMARITCGLNYPDTQAGLKGFRREAADVIFKKLRIYRYAFDVEALYLARRLGCSMVEVAARVNPQHAAQPTSINLIRDPVNMFGDLVRIRWNALLGRYR